MAAVSAPNVQQSGSLLGVFSKFDRVFGAGHRWRLISMMTSPGLSPASAEAEFGLNLRHDRAFDLLGNVELLAGLRIQVGHGHALQGVGLVESLAAIIGSQLVRARAIL